MSKSVVFDCDDSLPLLLCVLFKGGGKDIDFDVCVGDLILVIVISGNAGKSISDKFGKFAKFNGLTTGGVAILGNLPKESVVVCLV